ncbi:hypothetical protein EDD11_000197, partial [Mortierella claussenii]
METGDGEGIAPFEQQAFPWSVGDSFSSDRDTVLEVIRDWSKKHDFDVKVASSQRQKESRK